MVEECVTSEMRHHKQKSWPQAPKNQSDGRNVEHDGHWQDNDGNVFRVVVVARKWVAIHSKKTLKRNADPSQDSGHIEVLVARCGTAYQIEIGKPGCTYYRLNS
jgi:hypothetical protein